MIAYDPNHRNVLLDEFLTPKALIEACFEQAIVPYYEFISPPTIILDVGANDGRWGEVARKYFPDAHITGVEVMTMPDINPAYDNWYTMDFNTGIARDGYYAGYLRSCDLIIGNPPFTVKEENGVDKDGKIKYKIKYKAEDFVRTALNCLTPYGRLAFLLRSNFRHSLERYWKDRSKRSKPGLFQEHCPREVWDFALRASFYREDSRTEQCGTKQTNAHDNALFIWYKNWKEQYYIGKFLDWDYGDNM